MTTETATPFTSVRYEVYLLNNDAENPTDGLLAASTSDTYQYGGFHRTDLENGVVVREGQHFSVVVTQRTASGQYQIQAESAMNETGRETIKELLGWDIPTYSKGVVNEGESFFFEKDAWKDWTEGIKAIDEQSGAPGGND